MGTGEGKSLTCTCAVYLNALAGAAPAPWLRPLAPPPAGSAPRALPPSPRRARAPTRQALAPGAPGKGGSYLVTVNDYLARRDAEAMGQVYRFLGMSVGLIQARRAWLRPLLRMVAAFAAHGCSLHCTAMPSLSRTPGGHASPPPLSRLRMPPPHP